MVVAIGNAASTHVWSSLRTELRSWGTSGRPCRRRTVKNCERIIVDSQADTPLIMRVVTKEFMS